jgi:hypothetical protein
MIRRHDDRNRGPGRDADHPRHCRISEEGAGHDDDSAEGDGGVPGDAMQPDPEIAVRQRGGRANPDGQVGPRARQQVADADQQRAEEHDDQASRDNRAEREPGCQVREDQHVQRDLEQREAEADLPDRQQRRHVFVGRSVPADALEDQTRAEAGRYWLSSCVSGLCRRRAGAHGRFLAPSPFTSS